MKLLTWIKTETIKIIPAVVYFAIILNLIFFTSGLTLKPGEVRYFTYGSVTLIAMILGKVIIIVDAMPFFDMFPNKPLIYNIVWKFFLYAVFVLLVTILHIFIHSTIEHGVSMAAQKIQHEFFTPVFWATQMWLAMTFLGYVVFSEFADAFGKKNMMKMLFG